MGVPNIALCRIDNRLVHGQVGITWLAHSKANLILVADDDVAQDEQQQTIMRLTAEFYGAQIRFFTLQHTAQIIGQAAPSQRIFLITRTPGAMLELVKLGVPIQEVNVGNMHFSPGKRQISSRAYADEQELLQLKELQSLIRRLYFQDVPNSTVENIVL